jgi:DUF917 family protein
VIADDLPDIARGAAFLGTGGGGDPYLGLLVAQDSAARFGMPDVVSVSELPDDAQIFTAAMIGAPTVMIEKILNGKDLEQAVRALEAHLGRHATHIAPLEIGGVNSMVPIATASRLGLPLVDGDGMGRAFPELQMVTFNVFGVQASPMSVVDEALNTVIITASDALRTEKLARSTATEMGLSAAMSCYPMSGAQFKGSCVPGTLSLALHLGRAITEAKRTGDPIDALIAALRSTSSYSEVRTLTTGKVADVRRETAGGFATGECVIDCHGKDTGPVVVRFQNENIAAYRRGELLAIVPDLICIIDSETAEPITTERLRYGQRVTVLGVGAADIMRAPESLAIFGPRCFGLDEDFVPLESLHPQIDTA